MHGKGLFTYSNGHTYKGGFKNDMKEGKDTYASYEHNNLSAIHYLNTTNTTSYQYMP